MEAAVSTEMKEQVVISSPFPMSFAKLDKTSYRVNYMVDYGVWLMRMQDYLSCEGLWGLTVGRVKILEEPKDDKLDKDYEKKWEKYEAQQLLIEKAIGTIRLAMTNATAVRYHDSSFTTPKKIWDDVVSSYKKNAEGDLCRIS